MAKTVATVIGVVFVLVGIVGFIRPDLMGAHLTKLHNIVHLVSGVASLYFGTKATRGSARSFCLAFGLVYGLLGVVGYLVGAPDHMLTLWGQHFRLGPADHYIHIAIGVLYLIGGFTTKSGRTAASA
jgi:preprotein translocase subunit Sss1